MKEQIGSVRMLRKGKPGQNPCNVGSIDGTWKVEGDGRSD